MRQVSHQFIVITGVVIFCLAVLALLIVGPVNHGLRSWSKQLTQNAKGLGAPANRRHYQYAILLDPHNRTAIDNLAAIYANNAEWGRAIWILKLEPFKDSSLRIAQYQMAKGDLAAAIETAAQTVKEGNDSSMLELVKSQALLEEDQAKAALTAAQVAYKFAPSAGTRLQLALAAAALGQFDQIATLQSQASPAELVNLTKARAGEVALGQVLCGQKLYHTATRILRQAKSISVERFYLLASLDLQTGPHYHQAHTDLLAARGVDPSSVKVHQLLLSVDQKLKLTQEAAQEQKYLDQLQSGQI